MKALLELELPEIPLTPDYCQAVLRFMHEIKSVTFYASCYHALALQTRGVYVTADREYVKKAGRKGHVSLLSEWQISAR